MMAEFTNDYVSHDLKELMEQFCRDMFYITIQVSWHINFYPLDHVYVFDIPAMLNTIKRFWALCLDTHMKLALYKYAIIIIIIIIIISTTEVRLMPWHSYHFTIHITGSTSMQ